MQKPGADIDLDRLGVLAGALVLALALSRLMEIPVRPLLALTVFGSPLGVNLSATTLMLLVIAGMSVTAVSWLVHHHPLVQQGSVREGFIFWVIPGLLFVALAALLNKIENLAAWRGVLLACAVLIPFTLFTEYQIVDFHRRREPLWQNVQRGLIYLTAVLLFTLIYDARIRSLLSGPAVLVISLLLAGRLFWSAGIGRLAAWRYGMIAGLLLAQMLWVLNYWQLSSLRGGLLLLLFFYVIVGLTQQFLEKQFDDGQNGRRILLEYGGVAIVALLLVTLTIP